MGLYFVESFFVDEKSHPINGWSLIQKYSRGKIRLNEQAEHGSKHSDWYEKELVKDQENVTNVLSYIRAYVIVSYCRILI